MNYFYQTQPNPNPIAYFAHQAPPGWHAFETFGRKCVTIVDKPHKIELVYDLAYFIHFKNQGQF